METAPIAAAVTVAAAAAAAISGDGSSFGSIPTATGAAPKGGSGWVIAIIINVVASAFTVAGFVLQKKASSAHGRWMICDIVLTPQWLAGFALSVLVPIPGQVVAYSLAPMSLLTPLSGVSVALNIAFAPRLLGERLQRWPDMPASASILAGTVLTTFAGSHHDRDVFTFAELARLFGQAAFIWALLALVCAVFGCMGYMAKRRTQIELSAKARPSNPKILEVLLPAVVASGCGCLTNIALKGVGELLRGGAGVSQWILWLACAAMPAFAQINYVNRGLRLYMQTVFFPVYSALLVLTNTFYGLIFYNEYNALFSEAGRFTFFALGILFIVMGVIMFTFRRSDSETVVRRSLTAEMTSGFSDSEMGPRAPPARVAIHGVVADSGTEVSKAGVSCGWASIVD